MPKEKVLYSLTGVVRKFDETGPVVKQVHDEETLAVSDKQARSHIVSRTKKELGLLQSAKLVFEGKITRLE